MATDRPPRVMDPFAAEFWSFTEKKEFRLQRCSDCGKFRWPAAAVCDGCLSPEYDWSPVSGKGSVLSFVNFHRQYFPQYPAPHPAVAVELDEGPIFVCTPSPGVTYQDLSDGLRMELEWVDGQDRFGEYNLPVFKPVGQQ